MTKQLFIYATSFVRTSFFVLAAFEAYTRDWTGVFVATQAILISFVPFILRRYFGIYTPFILRVGIVFFLCSTLILGEVADFYNMFWWWDLVLHGVASVGITLIIFIFLLIFLTHIDVRSAALFTTLMAVGASLAVAVLWEIYEFIIDLFYKSGTPMQLSNTDTMTDLIVSVAGATLVGVFGYQYIKWRKVGWLSQVIHDGTTRNQGAGTDSH